MDLARCGGVLCRPRKRGARSRDWAGRWPCNGHLRILLPLEPICTAILAFKARTGEDRAIKKTARAYLNTRYGEAERRAVRRRSGRYTGFAARYASPAGAQGSTAGKNTLNTVNSLIRITVRILESMKTDHPAYGRWTQRKPSVSVVK